MQGGANGFELRFGRVDRFGPPDHVRAGADHAEADERFTGAILHPIVDRGVRLAGASGGTRGGGFQLDCQRMMGEGGDQALQAGLKRTERARDRLAVQCEVHKIVVYTYCVQDARCVDV